MSKCLVIVLVGIVLAGCSLEHERKPVGPQGSSDSYIPWNAPRPGEGQGAFGGAFDRQ